MVALDSGPLQELPGGSTRPERKEASSQGSRAHRRPSVHRLHRASEAPSTFGREGRVGRGEPLEARRKVLWVRTADPPGAGIGLIFRDEPQLERSVRSAGSVDGGDWGHRVAWVASGRGDSRSSRMWLRNQKFR